MRVSQESLLCKCVVSACVASALQINSARNHAATQIEMNEAAAAEVLEQCCSSPDTATQHAGIPMKPGRHSKTPVCTPNPKTLWFSPQNSKHVRQAGRRTPKRLKVHNTLRRAGCLSRLSAATLTGIRARFRPSAGRLAAWRTHHSCSAALPLSALSRFVHLSFLHSLATGTEASLSVSFSGSLPGSVFRRRPSPTAAGSSALRPPPSAPAPSPPAAAADSAPAAGAPCTADPPPANANKRRVSACGWTSSYKRLQVWTQKT